MCLHLPYCIFLRCIFEFLQTDKNLNLDFLFSCLRPYTPYNGRESSVWFDRNLIANHVPEVKASIDTTAASLSHIIQREIESGLPPSRIVIGMMYLFIASIDITAASLSHIIHWEIESRLPSSRIVIGMMWLLFRGRAVLGVICVKRVIKRKYLKKTVDSVIKSVKISLIKILYFLTNALLRFSELV